MFMQRAPFMKTLFTRAATGNRTLVALIYTTKKLSISRLCLNVGICHQKVENNFERMKFGENDFYK